MPHSSNNLYLILLISLSFLLFFGLGYTIMAEKNNKLLVIRQKTDHPKNFFIEAGLIENKVNSNYMASINGSFYYHFKCASARRIKDKNRIWFLSPAEALLSGYKEKKNCP